MSLCSIEGCDRKVQAKGYCMGHYSRLYRTGKVGEEVPLVPNQTVARGQEYGHVLDSTTNIWHTAGCQSDICKGYCVNSKMAQSKPRTRYTNARHAAKRRGIEFTLTYEQFLQKILCECYYCSYMIGKPVVSGSGLDRLDSSKGYTNENSVSCCSFCNKIKCELLTVEEMQIAIESILVYRGLL